MVWAGGRLAATPATSTAHCATTRKARWMRTPTKNCTSVVMQDRFRFNFVYSFTYDFLVEDDITSFAYCIPYTYSHLARFLQECKTKYPASFKVQILWNSLSGLKVPLVTITDDTQEQFVKGVVIVCARVHPGESNSSHVAEGLIKYLCSDDENVR